MSKKIKASIQNNMREVILIAIRTSIVHFVFSLKAKILQRLIYRIPFIATKRKALKYVGVYSRHKVRVSWNRTGN